MDHHSWISYIIDYPHLTRQEKAGSLLAWWNRQPHSVRPHKAKNCKQAAFGNLIVACDSQQKIWVLSYGTSGKWILWIPEVSLETESSHVWQQVYSRPTETEILNAYALFQVATFVMQQRKWLISIVTPYNTTALVFLGWSPNVISIFWLLLSCHLDSAIKSVWFVISNNSEYLCSDFISLALFLLHSCNNQWLSHSLYRW